MCACVRVCDRNVIGAKNYLKTIRRLSEEDHREILHAY